METSLIKILSTYQIDIFILIVFFSTNAIIVEGIKQLVISFPDKWGRIFKEGLPKEINRWLSFIFGYTIAWSFNYQLIEKFFRTATGTRGEVAEHLNYFILALTVMLGAKGVYNIVKKIYLNLTGKGNEKASN
jgi:hypothetical protein